MQRALFTAALIVTALMCEQADAGCRRRCGACYAAAPATIYVDSGSGSASCCDCWNPCQSYYNCEKYVYVGVSACPVFPMTDPWQKCPALGGASCGGGAYDELAPGPADLPSGVAASVRRQPAGSALDRVTNASTEPRSTSSTRNAALVAAAPLDARPISQQSPQASLFPAQTETDALAAAKGVIVRRPAGETIHSVEWINIRTPDGDELSAPVINGYLPQFAAEDAGVRSFQYDAKISFAEFRAEHQAAGFIVYGAQKPDSALIAVDRIALRP